MFGQLFFCITRKVGARQLSQPDGMRRPVSDGMLYAPKLSTRLKRKR
jgi:hypothetical protein